MKRLLREKQEGVRFEAWSAYHRGKEVVVLRNRRNIGNAPGKQQAGGHLHEGGHQRAAYDAGDGVHDL